jgi:hypothetical protein
MVLFAGGNVPSPTPTLSYASYGAFTITNYDSALTYNLSGSSSRSGSTFSVTVTSGSGSLSSTSPKGSNSPGSVTAYRLPYSTYFVQTGDPYVTYTTDGSNGGTYYDTDQWNPQDGSPAGFYAVVTPGYYAANDYTGSGYTYNSTYNEWWKIV